MGELDVTVYNADGTIKVFKGWRRCNHPYIRYGVCRAVCQDCKKVWQGIGYIREDMIMERQSVVSSNIASVGYDQKRHAMEVEFISGAVYRYSNVPLVVYRELLAAESHGKYFAARVRDSFSYVRISE